MSTDAPADAGPWPDALAAAALLAVDPFGLGGVAVRAHAGPVRDRWLRGLTDQLAAAMPVRRLPAGIADDRLLGGLDLTATLRAGRPVAERGLLAEADGGVVVVPMAERLSAAMAGRLALALDAGELSVERDGMALKLPARFGAVLLDEGDDEDERPPAALLERVALWIDLRTVGHRDALATGADRDEVMVARALLSSVAADADAVAAVCQAAAALGVGSARAPLFALRAARAGAALAGRDMVVDDDLVVAMRLVIAPRATRLPAEPPAEPEPAEDQTIDGEDPRDAAGGSDDVDAVDDGRSLDEILVAAAQAAIPASLLSRLDGPAGGRSPAGAAGRRGASTSGLRRGRPTGVRRGDPRSGARLSVIETLRAAAPWQGLRRASAESRDGRRNAPDRLEIRRDDFRVHRFKERRRTTTIFVVDASGSAAVQRLAEAKGAVELMLADIYVRRDQVALIAFRGTSAEILLPPTRSLARAKRSLAGLPGGGGTPLAAGIECAMALADACRRKGDRPAIVLLTDGRANIARDGTADRSRAEADAHAVARRIRAGGIGALVVDTSPRPRPQARDLADQMAAHYLPLPYADATVLSDAARVAAESGAACSHAA